MATRPIAAVLLVTAAVAACDRSISSACPGTAVEEAMSPDGRYVATLIHQECGAQGAEGAEAELRTALGVRDARAVFDPASQPTLLAIEGQHEIAFEWSSARSLTVSLPRSGTVLERADTWRDIRVDYQE
jgi:hypothetical protein